MRELPLGGEGLGAAVLAAYFVAVVAAAEVWRRVGQPRPETTRKLVHVLGGFGCLFFPLLVRSWWIVLAMSGALSVVFALAHRLGFLRSLHGVERTSRGVEYYPLAIFLVFLLADGRVWVYFAAVLTLAVADAFAALIGSRYGRLGYEIEENRKSLEGSLVFLVMAFLAVHLPMLLLTDLPRPVTVLAALHVALLVTGLEAIALRGTDNLWVPLGVAYILQKTTAQPFAEIVYQNASLILIAVGIAIAVWRVPVFQAGASLVFVLYAYGSWALGGWQWALPLLFGFGFFLAAWYAIPEAAGGWRVGVRAVERAVIPVFGILLLANTLHEHRTFYGPFVAANATIMALGLTRRVLHHAGPGRARRALRLVAASGVASLAVLVPPFLVQERVSLVAPLGALVLVIVATLASAAWEGERAPGDGPRWRADRIAACLGVAAAVLVLQQAGVIPPWNPFQRW